MRTKGARPPSIGWALILIGLIVGAAGLVIRARSPNAPPPLDAAAETAHGRVEQALRARARALEPAAAEAARVPELVASLNMGADRVTTQDLLENEDWWSRFRSRFAFTAVVADTTLALLGPGTGNVASSPIVQDARARGTASGLLAGDGRAFLAAAAAGQTGRAGKPPVVLLGEVLDGAKLAQVAGSTGDVIGVADGAKLLEAGGAGVPMRDLGPLVGRGGAPAIALPDGRAGAAWPLGGELFLLASFPAPPSPPSNIVPALLLVGTGALLMLVGVIVALLRRGGHAAPAHDQPGVTAYERPHGISNADIETQRAGAPNHDGPPVTMRPRDVNRDLPEGRAEVGPRNAEAPAARGGPVTALSFAPSGQSRMGRYELIERIGEGGMAEIFFAAARGEKNFVRYFVVKRMHAHVARHRESVDQFTDEARLQATLVHSNIVPVFDFGVEQGEYFLALEYIHGRDVGQLLERHVEHFGRPMDMATTFYVLHEALEALAFAHSQADKDGTPLEIVHRDVSPGNVLVSYRGEVKLTDFGIAKADRRLSRTEVGTVKGNAAFMSPEQARGEDVDQRSDIFSAGMVMYYCLSGQLLYHGETTVNRLLRAAVGPATAQFGQIDQLPRPAAKVLNRALAVDREKRYQTAAEFAHDLLPHMGTRQAVSALMDQLFPADLRRDLR
jgi:tRNA A-37 threonylcarbamoyl transferase component Bud32